MGVDPLGERCVAFPEPIGLVNEQGGAVILDHPFDERYSQSGDVERTRGQALHGLGEPRLARALDCRSGDQQWRVVAQVVGMAKHRPEGRCVALMRIHDDVFADRVRQFGQERGAIELLMPRLDLIERERLARQAVAARPFARLNALPDNFTELVVETAKPCRKQPSDAFTRPSQLNCVEPRGRVEDGAIGGVAQSAMLEIGAVEQDRHELGIVTGKGRRDP